MKSRPGAPLTWGTSRPARSKHNVRTHYYQPVVVATLLALSTLIGCTGEPAQKMNVAGFVSASGNHPPSVRTARLLPNPLVLNGPIAADIQAEDTDRNALSFRYRWFINGAAVPGEDTHELPPERLKRGDQVYVEVIPFDGTAEGAPYKTQPMVVGNTPPIVTSLVLEPSQAAPGDRLRARLQASDADHDDIRLTFRWWRNQSLVKEGEEGEIDTTGFSVKDVVRVDVTPYDAGAKGQTISSGPMVLGNSPPEIVSTPVMPTRPEYFEYDVQAKDAEGDPLTYVLETAPPGMIIDKTTGRISWNIPADLAGTHRVRVVVEDGQGGSSFQEFDVTLAPPQASSS